MQSLQGASDAIGLNPSSDSCSIVVFQTKNGVNFNNIEQFARAFFRWRSGSSDYKIFTLSKHLPQETLDSLKQAKVWHPGCFRFNVTQQRIFLDGRVPELTTLHENFFNKYLGRISLRVETIHVLPFISAQESSALTSLIQRYNFPIDKGYLGSIPDSIPDRNKAFLHAYHDKFQEKLKQFHRPELWNPNYIVAGRLVPS